MTTKKKIEITDNSRITANPGITLQEEPDRWGLLYDPNRDFSFSINPECVFLWKQLKYQTTINGISAKIKEHFTHVPMEIEKDVTQLIKRLLKAGFVTLIPGTVSFERETSWGPVVRGGRCEP